MGGEEKGRLERLQEAAEHRRKFAALKRDTLRKIEFLRRKTVIDPKDVYHVVKDFFKSFLEEDHEFTIKELKRELKKTYISNHTRKHIGLILDKLHTLEYRDMHATHEEMVQVLESFKSIVMQLVRIRTKKKGILGRLRSFFLKEDDEPEAIISELPAREDNDAENVRMHMLIERCYVALDNHKLRKAKAAYKALMEEYKSLPGKERQDFYPLLLQTHTDITNRARDL